MKSQSAVDREFADFLEKSVKKSLWFTLHTSFSKSAVYFLLFDGPVGDASSSLSVVTLKLAPEDAEHMAKMLCEAYAMLRHSQEEGSAP